MDSSIFITVSFSVGLGVAAVKVNDIIFVRVGLTHDENIS